MHVSVREAGQQEQAGSLDALRAGRNLDGCRGSDGDDPVAPGDHSLMRQKPFGVHGNDRDVDDRRRCLQSGSTGSRSAGTGAGGDREDDGQHRTD
jgi:hypothetical protein